MGIGRNGRVPKNLGAVPVHSGMYHIAADRSGLVRGISATQHAATRSGGTPVTQGTVKKRFYAEGQPKPHAAHAGPRRRHTATQRAGMASAVLNDAALRVGPRK